MRRGLIAVALLLGVPGTASAASFGELPFRPVTSTADCLAPTGVPGGLVRWTASGAELLDATPAGLVPRTTLALGNLRGCPAAAEDASGAGVVAGATSRGVRITVRDPGGAWGAPVTIPSKLAAGVTVALAPRGDALVAWTEYEPDYRHARLHVVRRAAGQAFGPPQRFERSGLMLAAAHAALTAAGEALLVLTDDEGVRLTSAGPGAAFPAPRRLLAHDSFDGDPALAVTPEGRALLAVPTDDGTAVFDREPGGDFVRRPTFSFGDRSVAVAMNADGTAIVAWESAGQVILVSRAGAGAFGTPVEVQPEQPRRDMGGSFVLLGRDGPPIEQPSLRVTLGAGDRALLTWPGRETGLQAATVTAAGQIERMDLGSPLRPAGGMTPLLLADGRGAVAWTDENELISVPPYAGRLHLAVESAPAPPAPAVPALTIGAPRDRTLRPSQTLRLPIRCSAACDVRGTIEGTSLAPTTSLSRAGTGELRFGPLSDPVAPRSGPLKVVVAWSAPGARSASSRTVTLRLRRLPAPRLPRLLNVRARRTANGVVDVRWSTDAPATDAYFVVYGTFARSLEADRAPKFGSAAGGTRRRSFHVRLRDAARVRFVHVGLTQPLGRSRIVRVRVQ